jgi:hypothetical protein
VQKEYPDSTFFRHSQRVIVTPYNNKSIIAEKLRKAIKGDFP